MEYLRLARATGAPVLALIAFALSAYFTLPATEFSVGYPLADAGPGLYSMTLSAPLVAVWGAFVSSSFARLASRPLSPPASAGRLIGVVAVGALATTVGTWMGVLVVLKPQFNLALAFAGFLPVGVALFASGMFGLAMGLIVSRYFALPIVAVTTWIWFSIPQSTSWVAGRNSNTAGPLILCCARLDEPSTVAISAGLSTGLAALLVGAAVLGTWQRRVLQGALRRLLTVLVAPALILAPGLAIGSFGSFLPTQMRSAAVDCVTKGEVQACVFPEAREGLESFAAAAGRIHEGAKASSLASPRVWTEKQTPGAAVLEWNPKTPSADQLGVVAFALTQFWRCDTDKQAELATAISTDLRSQPVMAPTTVDAVRETCDALAL